MWRLAGAAIWHASVYLCLISPLFGLLWFGSSWRSGLNWGACVAYSFLYVLQLGVVFAHRMVLSAREAKPLHFPQLGLHGRSWAAAFLSRVLLRGRKMQDLIGVAALLGSTCFCATSFLYGYPKLRNSQSTLMFSTRYGTLLGIFYTVQHLARWACIHGSDTLPVC